MDQIAINGNTIYLNGKPVAAMLDIDPAARQSFQATMAKLAMLDDIEKRVAAAYQILPHVAQGITAVAEALRFEATAPIEEDVFS